MIIWKEKKIKPWITFTGDPQHNMKNQTCLKKTITPVASPWLPYTIFQTPFNLFQIFSSTLNPAPLVQKCPLHVENNGSICSSMEMNHRQALLILGGRAETNNSTPDVCFLYYPSGSLPCISRNPFKITPNHSRLLGTSKHSRSINSCSCQTVDCILGKEYECLSPHTLQARIH